MKVDKPKILHGNNISFLIMPPPEGSDGTRWDVILYASPECQAEISDYIRERTPYVGNYTYERTWEFSYTQPTDYIMVDLLEHWRCNSDLEEIRPDQIGALTSAQMFSFDSYSDGNGDLISCDTVITDFEDYQTNDSIKDLYLTGMTEWTGTEVGYLHKERLAAYLLKEAINDHSDTWPAFVYKVAQDQLIEEIAAYDKRYFEINAAYSDDEPLPNPRTQAATLLNKAASQDGRMLWRAA